MNKKQLKELIDRNAREDGVTDTDLKGVKLYRVSAPVERTPAVYTPRFCFNVSGIKRVFQNQQSPSV